MCIYFHLFFFFLTWFVPTSQFCSYSEKLAENGSCISLNNLDVLKALHFLANPLPLPCNKLLTTHGTTVCEDNLPTSCRVWSVIASDGCSGLGTLDFERFYASEKRCSVVILHFQNSNESCLNTTFQETYPRIELKRYDVWDELPPPNILMLQRPSILSGRNENAYANLPYVMLSDIYLNSSASRFVHSIDQIIFTVSYTSKTLTDGAERESENAWNIWATRELLHHYGAVSRREEAGPYKLRPLQFDHLLNQAKVSTQTSYYYITYMKIIDKSNQNLNEQRLNTWKPNLKSLKGKPPTYCMVPSLKDDYSMQQWIESELKARCHPYALRKACNRARYYDGFVPCRQELMNYLAEDYAITKGWCDFHHKNARIQPLKVGNSRKNKDFTSFKAKRKGSSIRIAFLFTVYHDYPLIERLFNHLYKPYHYYLFHIDPSNNEIADFLPKIRQLIHRYQENVFLSTEIPVVYGASTASLILSKGMAWFLKNIKDWDYLISLTGSDYPLMPLTRLEKILSCQSPPMPFLMAWTPGTSTHLFRLQKTHPIFEQNTYLDQSIKAVIPERGNPLGIVPMVSRSSNFGPPLFCNKQSSYYRLDNRRNKSGLILDTQWLFPRDIFRSGYAIGEERPDFTTKSILDGQFRVWKKSDPATTAIYNRKTVNYIVNSVEGSEEHYYISLLYNWNKDDKNITKSFIQTLSSEMVWNTWKIGLSEKKPGFQTHTNYLTLNEWDIIKGFSLRGMMFVRKFSSMKNMDLMNKIDREILFNESSDAGYYWPGFYEVDAKTLGKQWKKEFLSNRTKKDSIYKMDKNRVREIYSKVAQERFQQESCSGSIDAMSLKNL
eukprot:gene5249-5629_t